MDRWSTDSTDSDIVMEDENSALILADSGQANADIPENIHMRQFGELEMLIKRNDPEYVRKYRLEWEIYRNIMIPSTLSFP